MDLAVAAGHELLIVHGRDRKLWSEIGGLSRGRPLQLPSDRVQEGRSALDVEGLSRDRVSRMQGWSGSRDPLRMRTPQPSYRRPDSAQESPSTSGHAEASEAKIDHLHFAFAIASIALGDFVWDEQHRTDIALLAEDGTVRMLERKIAEAPKRGEMSTWETSHELKVIDSVRLGVADASGFLTRVKVSSLPADDLALLDPGNHRLHILTTDEQQRTLEHGLRIRASLDLLGAPVAVLPMRLALSRRATSVPTA